MKLTKQQVLDLIKVLSHYETFDQVQTVNVPYGDLLVKFEEFLVNNNESGKHEKADKVKKANKVSSKQANKAKFLEQEDEESYKAYDRSEEFDGEGDRENEEADASDTYGHIAVDQFKVLTKKDSFTCNGIDSELLNPYDKAKLEFWYEKRNIRNKEKRLFVYIDNFLIPTLGKLAYIRRSAKKIEFTDDVLGTINWHAFYVNKFPKSLTKLLPCNKLLKIV